MNRTTLITLIFAAGIVGAAMPASAENGTDETAEVLALKAAKLSATEASQAAAAKFPGMVSSVQIYNDAGKPAYHVEIVGADGRQQDISVDAVSGEIMKMANANEDDGDGEHADGSGHQEIGEGED